jgi:hypothetical protein
VSTTAQTWSSGLELQHHGFERARQLAVGGIAHFGPVQGDQRDMPFEALAQHHWRGTHDAAAARRRAPRRLSLNGLFMLPPETDVFCRPLT